MPEEEAVPQESIRSYRVERGTAAVLAVAGVLALFLLAGIVVNPEAGHVLLLFLAALLILSPVMSWLTAGTTIEIDGSAGLVQKTMGPLFRKKKNTYSLRDVDAVRLIEKNSIVEEGYGITSYSIVLEGKGASQELLATYDEPQARTLHRELVALIDLSGK